MEMVDNKPVNGPEDVETTQRLRLWFRNGQVFVPDNMQETMKQLQQQREVDSIESLSSMARSFGEMIAQQWRSVGNQEPTEGDLAGFVKDNFNDERLIRWMIRACYGNSESRENHIPCAETRVTPEWFAFHNARAMLALIGAFLQKYGLTEEPGKKFPNTKLDIDYLVLLHYADALASDETSGDMFEMCNRLYGTTKKRISSRILLEARPSDDELRFAAYCRWNATGQTHGHDVDDWLLSEIELYQTIWQII